MFILELTHRSWAHSEENKRRTLQRNDIAAAITRTDTFDFLVPTILYKAIVVPRPHAVCSAPRIRQMQFNEVSSTSLLI